MKPIGIRFIAFLILICLLIPTVSVFADNEVLTLYMSYSGNSYVGGEINLRIAVSKPTSALAGLEFILDYDETYLKPIYTVNTENGKEMDALVTKIPYKWEQMSYHSSDDGFYHFRFAMPDDGDYYLNSVGGLVLNIPFKVIKAGSFDFSINNEDIIAIVADNDFSPMSGVGGDLSVVAYSEAQKLAIEFNSEDVAREGETYYAEIKATNLGDTSGIIGLEFVLYYDKSVFKPKITSNDSEQMNAFMSDMPNNGWEQMCSYDETSGKYTLRFAALHCESLTQVETLISGNSLSIKVPFEVIGIEGVIGGFSVDSTSVIAINNNNVILRGSGDTKSVSVEKSVSAFNPEQFGFTVKDNCLLNIAEKTSVSKFLSYFDSLYLTDKSGKRITDGYVCTEYILTDGSNIRLSLVVRGDGNGDGQVNSTDYLYVKRYCFRTLSVTTAQKYALAVSNNKEISSNDYLLIKRHCFGTYDINKG
ncbi:MAG: dockerin type I repeat-containing protein [Clostridia bacterium]|nr:dockerin type I repeat-containing protein [Clostridia bacterium]